VATAASKAEAERARPPDPLVALARKRVLATPQEVEALRSRLADVERRIALFQARVDAAPRHEQEVIALRRDYQMLREKYSALLAKRFDAEIAAHLERRSKGRAFRVIDPAVMPEAPSFPNRGLFAVAGALCGLLLGVGLALLVDFLDPTIKDVQELRTALSYPVLAVIPYIKPRDQRRLAAVSPDDTQPRSGSRRVRRMSKTVPSWRAAGRGESA